MTADKLHDDEVRALERPGAGRESLVPASYAEKAMSSLLRLHEDLVEEKEKRIDLYRRLMEREQSLAEIRAYVKLLEGELARRGFDPTAYAIDPVSAPAPTPERYQAVAMAAAASRSAPVAQEPPAAPPPAAAAPRPPPVAAATPRATPAAPPPAPPRAATQPAAAAAGPTSVPVPPQPQVASPATETAAPVDGPAPVIAWTPGPSGKIGAIR